MKIVPQLYTDLLLFHIVDGFDVIFDFFFL